MSQNCTNYKKMNFSLIDGGGEEEGRIRRRGTDDRRRPRPVTTLLHFVHLKTSWFNVFRKLIGNRLHLHFFCARRGNPPRGQSQRDHLSLRAEWPGGDDEVHSAYYKYKVVKNTIPRRDMNINDQFRRRDLMSERRRRRTRKRRPSESAE